MFEEYAAKIPADDVEKVKAAVEHCRENKLRADRETVKYLFDIYKTLAPHDRQKIDCRACRSKVIGIFIQIVKVWQNNN